MKTKKRYSFSKVIIIQFAIYTFIVLGGSILINIFVNWRLNNSFLVLDDFLKYEDKLKYEDYGGIPMAKFPGCDFAVYDNNTEQYKNGFKTICDIGEERIRRAGKKIFEETNADIDYGFRVYKVDSSNMKDIY